MNIEEFRDVRVFLETDNTETQKYYELDYCIPMCDTCLLYTSDAADD